MMNVAHKLNVPSGKIVFANDLREYYRVIGSHDIMSKEGLKATFDDYEKIGMIHYFVGNTCPEITQKDSKHLAIEHVPFISNVEEEKLSDVDFELREKERDQQYEELNKRSVGSIITDLWWFCAVDYDDLIKHIEKDARDIESYMKNMVVVDVTPGVYEFEYLILDQNLDYASIFTEIKWIKEPDPIVDYQKVFLSQSRTVKQEILQSLYKYPTLYKKDILPKKDIFSLTSILIDSKGSFNPGYLDEDRVEVLGFVSEIMEKRREKLLKIPLSLYSADELTDMAQRVANQLFCVGGSGVDWHPNGWGSSSAEFYEGEEEYEFGLFDKRYSWYPFSEDYSALSCAAGLGEEEIYLNEDFRALAFNVAYSIAKYGSSSSHSEHTQELGKKCLKGLAKKYPDSVPDYCKQLLKEI